MGERQKESTYWCGAYIEVPNACEVVVYNYNGVPVRKAHLKEGSNRIYSLNAGLYLVQIGDAQAVPVRVR